MPQGEREVRPGDLVPNTTAAFQSRENGRLGKWEGDGGKGGCTAKMMTTHVAVTGQVLRQAFDKLLQVARALDFLKVSSSLNFKALGRRR